MSTQRRAARSPDPAPDREERRRSRSIVEEDALAPASVSTASLPTIARAAGNRAAATAIQAKLTVGPAGDALEKEADRVARRVVTSFDRPVQRQEDEEEELQAKRIDGVAPVQRQGAEDEELQMQPDGGGPGPVVGLEGGGLDAATETGIESARGSGRPLDETTRATMERAFGTGFGDVRVHHSAESDRHNRAIQAKAFTSGSDIFFRSGDYAPSTARGRELIAHELTHVVQQRGGIRPDPEVRRAPDDEDDVQWTSNPLYDDDTASPATTRDGGVAWTSNPLFDANKARPSAAQEPRKKDGWFARKGRAIKKGFHRTFGVDFSNPNKRAEALPPDQMKQIGEQIRAAQVVEQQLIAGGAEATEAYDRAYEGVPAEFRPPRRTAAERAVRRNERAMLEGNVAKSQEQQAAIRQAAVSKRLAAKGWSEPEKESTAAATAGKWLGVGGSLAGATGMAGKQAQSIGKKGQKLPLFGEVIGKDEQMESGGRGTSAVSSGLASVLNIASSIAKIKDASARAKSESPAEREKGMDDLQAAVIGLGQSAQSANTSVNAMISHFKDGAAGTPGLAIIANAQTLITQIPDLAQLSTRVHTERSALADAEKSGADASLALSIGRILSRNAQLLAHHVVTMANTINKLVASIVEVTPGALAAQGMKTVATIVDVGNKASKVLIDSYRAGKTQEARGGWQGTHAEGTAEKLLAADAQHAIQTVISEARDGNPIAVRVMSGYNISPTDLGKESDRNLRELLMGRLQEVENPRTVTQKIVSAAKAVKNLPAGIRQKHRDVKALGEVKNQLGYGGKKDRGKGWYVKQMLFGKTAESRGKVMEDIGISQQTGQTTTGEAFGEDQAKSLTDRLYGRDGEKGDPHVGGPMTEEEIKALSGASRTT